MRFEILAAYVIGILLPVLETCRRGFGHWTINTMTMLEDYAGGGLLLLAAVLTTRGRRSAGQWLLVAWSAVSAMMALSFLHHLEETLRGEDVEPNNSVVLAFKILLLVTSLVALILSFRHARGDGPSSASSKVGP